jgi:autotransporter strand-loop-strand O-heptosyltransferase
MKVRAHTCYLGTAGYAAHAREFFRALSKRVDLRVRNFTWDDNPSYLNSIDFDIIDTITLSNSDGTRSDYPIATAFPKHPWKNKAEGFVADVDIVLMDMDHHYFYDEYTSGTTIAFTVWESTQLPTEFFEQLLKFDYLWVVSEWHREVAINQGYPEHRVLVVHEGVNEEFLTNTEVAENEDFNFLFFGRWDYRKAVPEIVDSFIKAFPNGEKVKLILNADNPYAVDGMTSTEERLAHYGYTDDRIEVKHFMSREEYVRWIKTGDVLITCARSEGWNIPLIEAMAAGTPAIYSNWGAQLEFAEGLGIPVEIAEERPAEIGAQLGFAGATPGLYAEPDYRDLIRKLKFAYENYEQVKAKAEEDKEIIRTNFNWDKVGEEGYATLCQITNLDMPEAWQEGAVVIMSHADTEEKVRLLKQSIIAVKKQGYPVIVSSHIQVPGDIYQLADYVVWDKENPVVFADEYSKYSNMTPVHQFKYNDFELAYGFDFNHGYAALKLIKNGLSIASINQYPVTHFINYDYVINTPEVLQYHNHTLLENDIVTYRWGVEDSLNTGLFSIRTEKVLPAFNEVNSKRDYFKYDNLIVLEDIVFKIFKDYGFKVDILDINSIQNGNILNEVMTSAYPQLTKKGLATSFCYLSQNLETGEKYISVISGGGEFDFTITVGHQISQYRASGRMQFIQVTDLMLQLGIEVEFPDYGVTNYYDMTSKMASCIVRNRGYIKELNTEVIDFEPVINIHFVDGPFVEVLTDIKSKYLVEFIDLDCDETVFLTEIGNNCWSRCNRKWFTNWKIRITNLSTNKSWDRVMDLTGQRVMVSLGSSSLGDTISWFAPIEEFQKKHGCKIIVCTFKNELFEQNYPQFEWVKPGVRVDNLHASYNIGWFYNGDQVNREMHPREFKSIPMQATASDILGLPQVEVKPRLVIKESARPIEEDYVCIAVHSTAQAKYWNNPTGWQEITDYFLAKGLKVVMLSIEEDGYMGNPYPKGVTLISEERTFDTAIRYLHHSKMFIGIGSGLSWLSWATGTTTVIISGFSEEWTETIENTIRITNPVSCNSCFNRYKLDAGDWNWCPDHKGTERQFECTKLITGAQVIKQIEDWYEKNN